MTIKHAGWTFIIGGAVLIIAEASAGADAAVTGTPFNETAIGKYTAPIEKYLPVSLGVTLVAIGAALAFIVPRFRR